MTAKRTSLNSGGNNSQSLAAEKRALPLRVYVREIPGLAAGRQRALAIEAGVPDRDTAPIYTEGRNTFPAERTACLNSFRRAGEELGVARLVVLAKDRKDLRDVMSGLGKAGIVVRELATGRRSDDAGALAEMILDAVNFWSSRARTFTDPAAAAAAGSSGGKATARRRRRMRMPKNLAIEFWRDKALDNEVAIAKMNADPEHALPWTESTAYRVLGPRNAFAGRRGKNRG